MKILHALGWYFPDTLGGSEIYVKALAARQVENHHEVAVAAPRPGATVAELTEDDGVRIFRYPTPSHPTRREAQGRDPARGSEHFRDYLESSRPDVLHVHTFTTGLGVHEIERARELGVKAIATNHLASVGYICQRGTLMKWGTSVCDGIMNETTCAACALHARGVPRIIAHVASQAGRWTGARGANLPGRVGTGLGMTHLIAHNERRNERLLGCLDRFVVLNRITAKVAIGNGCDPAKLAINYLGVSHRTAERKPSVDERPTTAPVAFGCIGRFQAIKGVVGLARTAVSLPPEIAFTLEIRGPADDAESAAVRRAVEDIVRDDGRVRIAPAAPPDEVPGIVARYDVLLVPSIAFEGGPTVVSEAHAVGTPVVGTRVGAMPELIDDGVNGALLDAGDWSRLAAILTDVATRPRETIDAWRSALPNARTMDDVARDYESLYRELFADEAN